MIFSENRYPLFGIMLYWWSMIFSENRYPLFGIMLYWWSIIFSENRYPPLFGIMLWRRRLIQIEAGKRLAPSIARSRSIQQNTGLQSVLLGDTRRDLRYPVIPC